MAEDSKDIVNITEIVRFSGFETNEAEADTFKLVTTIDGNRRSYHGTQVDEASNGIWFQEWQSLAHHVAFQQSEVYPSLISSVPKFAKMAPEVMHVRFQPYPATASFEAPLLEVLFAALKPGTLKEDFEAAVLESMKVVPEVSKASFGVLLEDDRKYVLVNGWESPEQIQEVLAKESTKKAFAKVGDLADIDFRLYKLLK